MPRHARKGLGLLAVTALVAGLVGCSTPAASQDTITFAIEGANLSDGHMDIHSTQLDVGSLVLRNVFDSLVYQDADGRFQPWLATGWEISDDGLEYTFTLRDDVTFHDGEKFDAEVVKQNFDHVIDPETASAQAASLLGYAEEDGYYRDTVVVDEFTVRIELNQPYAPLLQGLSLPQLGFYSPVSLTDHRDELRAGGPGITVGTGPFVLDEFVPNQELRFSAFEGYDWAPEGSTHQGRAASDNLVIWLLPESSARAGALNSGEADVIADVTPAMVSQLAGQELHTVSLPGLPYSLYLNEGYGAFADPAVREAFRIGFDLDAAVQTIFGGNYERAWSILSPGTPNSYDPSLEGTWPYDAARAGEILDDAGWTGRDAEGYRTKDGERLSVRWIAWTPVADENAALADVIQSDLKSIGFELIRDVLEPAGYMDAYVPRDFDLTDWGFSSPDADVLRSHLRTGGYQNVNTVSYPEVDTLLDEAVANDDVSERERLYREVQQWNDENILIVPLYVPAETTAWRPGVTGIVFDLYGRASFYAATATVQG